jgi:hypothetical protein
VGQVLIGQMIQSSDWTFGTVGWQLSFFLAVTAQKLLEKFDFVCEGVVYIGTGFCVAPHLLACFERQQNVGILQYDCQSAPDKSLLVMVVGTMDKDNITRTFSQIFVLGKVRPHFSFQCRATGYLVGRPSGTPALANLHTPVAARESQNRLH